MIREIPLTVVAGYLGSGKTSLIIDLLQDDSVGRVGVIVNDFGELNIDAELLGDADGIVGFDNGCVCCSASDGLGPALEQLKGAEVEHIILEASGVSDPGPLAAWGKTPGLSPGGVVVCADVKTLPRKVRDRWVGETVAHQLGNADVVLLTHDDIASPRQRQLGEEAVRRHVPNAAIAYRQEYGLRTFLLGNWPHAPAGDLGPGHHAQHETLTLSPTREVTEAALREGLRQAGDSVRRVKGFLKLSGQESLVQMVDDRLEISPVPEGAPERDLGLVVIADQRGRALLDGLLNVGFEIRVR